MKKTNALNLSDILAGYYKPTPGSMAFSLAIMATLLGPDPHHITDDPLLTDRVNDALQKANHATSLTFDWDANQRLDLMHRTGAREADNAADRAVSALYNAIDNYRQSGPGDPEYDIADKLLKTVMPQGVQFITGRRFEDQFGAVNSLLDRLDNAGKAAVDTLKVNHFVEKLRTANHEYGQLLTSTGNTGLTHAEVLQATTLAQEATSLVIITVWSLYPFEQDREIRNKLLAPIHEQNGRFRAHYARKKKAPKVDAKTGEFTDAEETDPVNYADSNIYPHLPGGFPNEPFDSDPSQPNA